MKIKKLQLGLMKGERVSIMINNVQCDVVYVRDANGGIKLGFDAPEEVRIFRHNFYYNAIKPLSNDDWKEE